MKIDLRSDTFTKPSASMLEVMKNAEVGDDVFGEDTSVNELEKYAAELFGMESALYCPTGTMSNQVAIKTHTQPGDEVICDKTAHVYQYEGGGIAFNSGCQVKLITGDRGRVSGEQVLAAINPDDVHKAHSSLVCLENSSNRGGGSCYDLEEIKRIQSICDHYHLKLHLDGARLFNALVAKKETPVEYGEIFDSISICLNKGLGCPIGSILMGGTHFINKARRIRKVLGGGMRQAGYMAVTGIYALKNNIDRLADDHAHAKYIAEALIKKDFTGAMLPVETNIIIFEVHGRMNPTSLSAHLYQQNIMVIPISQTQVRMVLHLDITPEMVAYTIDAIHKL